MDAAIEDVLTEIYKKYDVKTGDIDPFQALALDEYIEQIARHEQIAEHTEQIVDLYIELIKMNCNNLVKII